MTRVALLTQDLSQGGGLATMTDAVVRALGQPPAFDVQVLSLAVSSRDALSARALSPATWRDGVRIERRTWRHVAYRHVGAVAPEFDPQRYAPRRLLTDALRESDLVQFVTATAAWANTARHAGRPISIWAATTIAGDRAAMVSAARGSRRWTGLIATRVLQRLERRALKTANLVHALSRYTADGMTELVPGLPVHLTPCGVDTALFAPAPVRSSAEYIISVARFSDPRKNVALLIRAYGDAVANNAAVPDLWLVGEPPSRGDQALIRSLGLEKRVRLCGVKAGTELADLYRGAAFFVLSSLEEGLGIVVLEAMASGLAVVSTRCGGPEMLIDDGVTGVLVPNDDRPALARAIESMASNEERRAAIAGHARKRAVDEYSFDLFARRFRESYAAIGW